jgi:hypothetical protein
MEEREPRASEGGCICGSVRFRVSAPALEVVHCHCTICRRSSGAPFVTWATFAISAFALTSGAPAERRSSPSAIRSFCPRCGTQLTFREIARPSWIDVTVGSFDRPEDLQPDHHIFTANQLPWMSIDDALPRHPEANPAERKT